MKANKIFYWVFTGLIGLWMLVQGVLFILGFNEPSLREMFENLGHSPHIILPLGIAKILAVVAIVIRKYDALTYLAYLGLALDFILAIVAHAMTDQQYLAAIIALVLLLGSFFFYRKIDPVSN